MKRCIEYIDYNLNCHSFEMYPEVKGNAINLYPPQNKVP